jgi:hypothetical protein
MSVRPRASLKRAHLGSFFFEHEDMRKQRWGPFGTLVKEQGSFNLVIGNGIQRVCFKA